MNNRSIAGCGCGALRKRYYAGCDKSQPYTHERMYVGTRFIASGESTIIQGEIYRVRRIDDNSR